jgi:hypothetical protein
MKPKGSLLCFQEPTSRPCSDLDQSSPHFPFYFFKIHFLSCHLRLGLLKVYSFRFAFQNSVWNSHLILLDLITHHLVISANYEILTTKFSPGTCYFLPLMSHLLNASDMLLTQIYAPPLVLVYSKDALVSALAK